MYEIFQKTRTYLTTISQIDSMNQNKNFKINNVNYSIVCNEILIDNVIQFKNNIQQYLTSYYENFKIKYQDTLLGQEAFVQTQTKIQKQQQVTLLRIDIDDQGMNFKFNQDESQILDFYSKNTQAILDFLHLDQSHIIYSHLFKMSHGDHKYFYIYLSNLKKYNDTFYLKTSQCNISKKLDYKLKYGQSDKYGKIKQHIMNAYLIQYQDQPQNNPFINGGDGLQIISKFTK